MHFPEIIRRSEYKKTRNGTYYADYREYLIEISEDCKHRCVYCDAQLEEVGGEGMHLDHFRPQKHFPELANTPENLVLACARCNQLKSDWWPEKSGNSNNGQHGFIDPFDKDKSTYFEVDLKGEILAKRPPSAYIIELLSLNRVSRIRIRRQRVLTHRANQLIEKICQEMNELQGQSLEVILQRLPILAKALQEVRVLI
jgi:uncharacterized protein (TIGR02646 family)